MTGLNHEEVIRRTTSIQEQRFDATVGFMGSSYPQVGPDTTLATLQQEFEILSQETGISVLILEVIGSMHFQVKLAERENRTYDPRMGMSKDTEKELKKLGFTIPNPTFRFGH